MFKRLQTTKALPSTQHFAQRLMLDRILNKANLEYRVERLGDSLCVLCCEENEITNSLFITCKVVQKIWNRYIKWVGVNFISHSNKQNYFQHFHLMNLNTNQRSRTIKFVFHLFIYLTLLKLQCNKQQENVEYRYYVMYWMKTIIHAYIVDSSEQVLKCSKY